MSNYAEVGPVTYFKYPELAQGDVLINDGTYIETSEGTYGPQHFFEENESGERKCLNSSGQLNWWIGANLIGGKKCRIVYDGTVTLEKGTMKGKEAHQFKMMLDLDQRIEKKSVQQELPLDADDLV